MKQIIDKGLNILVTIGLLAAIYGGVFYISSLLSTHSEPVNVPDVDVPDISSLSDCEKHPLIGDIAKFFPNASSCDEQKYSDLHVFRVLSDENSPDQINTASIINKAKKIQIEGKLKQIFLYISATVDDGAYAPTRKNAVFFLVDGGDYQGYLRASRTNGSDLDANSPGVFLSKDVPKIMIEDLNQPIPVSARAGATGTSDVNFFEKINSPGTHLIYSYVSKPTYGKILDLSLAYSCETPSCALNFGK